MKPTAKLHDVGQSLWLDNITRTMLADGTLQGYIEELSVTGLTSNPTIFDKSPSSAAATFPSGESEPLPPSGSSSSWPSPTCATRPISSSRSTSAPPVSTASARSRSRR
jgi:hypothetical protein